MDKQAIIDFLFRHKIVAILRMETSTDLVSIIHAVVKGGVHCVEITMTTPGGLSALERASGELKDGDILLGAGTVLDGGACESAIRAGAQYIITPVLVPEVIATAHRYDKPVCCGAYTPTEIYRAWEDGADIVKVFPAQLGGPGYIRAVRAPLAQIPLMPTGGITIENAGDYLKAGAVALGVGGSLVSADLVERGDFDVITENTRAFVKAVRAAIQ